MLLILSFFANQVFGGSVQLLPALPSGVYIGSVQVDADGNIYVAGWTSPANPKPAQDLSDVYVAKLSADGSQIRYRTVLAGSGEDHAFALVLGPDNSVYATGYTNSADFPTTSGSLPDDHILLPRPNTRNVEGKCNRVKLAN